ncbi:RING-H2 finger protein ATL2-like [Bidens hawaiensis]|uniref:RING-H2 finger protein ATL2-like n=1 Tax=Bidens hawaiensis TaxID=980011 RepID=UPI00404A11F3
MSSDSPIHTRRIYTKEPQDDSSKTYALSGKIMLTSIICLFVVVVFLVLLHLYSRWYLQRLHRRNNIRRSNRSTRVYYVDNNVPLASPRGGLHASVIKSLPLFIYSPESNASIPECAVCLSEFEDGETGRVLPNCKHKFHIGCIDMWFFSNSTCPLCRSPVEPVQPQILNVTEPGSSVSSPDTTSSGDMRKLRVDVRIDLPSRSDSVAENEFRSPGSRLLSLKMIINMNRKSPMVSPSSSCVSDLEHQREESDQESSRSRT